MFKLYHELHYMYRAEWLLVLSYFTVHKHSAETGFCCTPFAVYDISLRHRNYYTYKVPIEIFYEGITGNKEDV